MTGHTEVPLDRMLESVRRSFSDLDRRLSAIQKLIRTEEDLPPALAREARGLVFSGLIQTAKAFERSLKSHPELQAVFPVSLPVFSVERDVAGSRVNADSDGDTGADCEGDGAVTEGVESDEAAFGGGVLDRGDDVRTVGLVLDPELFAAVNDFGCHKDASPIVVPDGGSSGVEPIVGGVLADAVDASPASASNSNAAGLVDVLHANWYVFGGDFSSKSFGCWTEQEAGKRSVTVFHTLATDCGVRTDVGFILWVPGGQWRAYYGPNAVMLGDYPTALQAAEKLCFIYRKEQGYA